MSESAFRFGLERVRELRVHQEDLAREQFAASLHRRARGAAMLEAAHELIADAQAGQRVQANSGAVSSQDLLSRQRWIERLERHRASAITELAQSDAELTVKRGELSEARQRREVLEKLKDRQRDEHTMQVARREGARLDEVALNAHVRRTVHAR